RTMDVSFRSLVPSSRFWLRPAPRGLRGGPSGSTRMSTGKSTMRNYEAVVVVDPRLDEPAISQAVDRFTKVIGSKGEVTRLDRWGRRRLAYEINHLTEGFYVVAAFKA